MNVGEIQLQGRGGRMQCEEMARLHLKSKGYTNYEKIFLIVKSIHLFSNRQNPTNRDKGRKIKEGSESCKKDTWCLQLNLQPSIHKISFYISSQPFLSHSANIDRKYLTPLF